MIDLFLYSVLSIVTAFACGYRYTSLPIRKCAKIRFFCVKIAKILWAAGGCASRLSVGPPSLYQNLGERLITIAIFRFLKNQRDVFQAKNAANCGPSSFFIVLSYFGGFAAQLLVCNAAH